MNDRRRSKIKEVIKLLDRASGILSDVSDEEQNCLDNMPENLQDSERCSKMENNIDLLELCIESITEMEESFLQDVLEV